MEFHKRKKIEIVVEAVKARDVLAWLARRGVKGHSLIPNVSGFGRQGTRTPADVAGIFENVLIVAVAGEEVARQVLAESVVELRDYAAIVLLSDVEVARGDHF